jgi:hypothetical protein
MPVQFVCGRDPMGSFATERRFQELTSAPGYLATVRRKLQFPRTTLVLVFLDALTVRLVQAKTAKIEDPFPILYMPLRS